jgi:ribosomal protein L37AE/L43A
MVSSVDGLAGAAAVGSSGAAAASRSCVGGGNRGLGASRRGSNSYPLNVCYGSKADMTPSNCDVCFTPKSRHRSARWQCPLCANSGHGGAQQSQQLDQGHNRSGARSLFDRIDDAKIL